MKRSVSIALLLAAALSLFVGCTNGGAPAATPPTGNQSSFDTSKNINLVSREPGSGTRGAFIELLGIEMKGADGSKRT